MRVFVARENEAPKLIELSSSDVLASLHKAALAELGLPPDLTGARFSIGTQVGTDAKGARLFKASAKMLNDDLLSLSEAGLKDGSVVIVQSHSVYCPHLINCF